MTKPKPDKPFVEGLSIAGLLKEPEQKAKAKTAEELSRTPGWFDYTKEIRDDEDGWIYQKLRNNKKGKKLRKFLQQLHGDYSRKNNISFWKPKINDLAFCEAKRWMAVQYQQKQLPKITGVFEQVLKNTPFCCIRLTDEAPGFAWVVFPHYEVHDGFRRGVSWEWWESNYQRRNKEQNLERPNCQLRQDIGDAWFHYEERSRQIRQRVGYFEQLFHMALEKRYSYEFYRDRDRFHYKKKLIINGREYLIGETNGRSFGVIAYPETTITEIVEPGPPPHSIKE